VEIIFTTKFSILRALPRLIFTSYTYRYDLLKLLAEVPGFARGHPRSREQNITTVVHCALVVCYETKGHSSLLTTHSLAGFKVEISLLEKNLVNFGTKIFTRFKKIPTFLI